MLITTVSHTGQTLLQGIVRSRFNCLKAGQVSSPRQVTFVAWGLTKMHQGIWWHQPSCPATSCSPSSSWTRDHLTDSRTPNTLPSTEDKGPLHNKGTTCSSSWPLDSWVPTNDNPQSIMRSPHCLCQTLGKALHIPFLLLVLTWAFVAQWSLPPWTYRSELISMMRRYFKPWIPWANVPTHGGSVPDNSYR